MITLKSGAQFSCARVCLPLGWCTGTTMNTANDC